MYADFFGEAKMNNYTVQLYILRDYFNKLFQDPVS